MGSTFFYDLRITTKKEEESQKTLFFDNEMKLWYYQT